MRSTDQSSGHVPPVPPSFPLPPEPPSAIPPAPPMPALPVLVVWQPARKETASSNVEGNLHVARFTDLTPPEAEKSGLRPFRVNMGTRIELRRVEDPDGIRNRPDPGLVPREPQWSIREIPLGVF